MNDLRDPSSSVDVESDTQLIDTQLIDTELIDTQIDAAVRALQHGQVVAFPTETVYGLGADARNPAAIADIFAIKGRPANHPVIVHLASKDMLPAWAKHLSDAANTLAEAFMPGPLTLIVDRQDDVLDAVTGGQASVGLRVPSHPVAQALLEVFGGGVAAPSANRFGRISPTTAAHVRSEFAGDTRVAHVLEGGDCQVGLESTIVDVRAERVKLLRPGGVSLDELAGVLGYVPDRPTKNIPRTSGNLERHYAPMTPTRLMSRSDLDSYLFKTLQPVGVVSTREQPVSADEQVWRTLPAIPHAYGRLLYATLRDLDNLGQAGDVTEIIIEHVPNSPAWLAVQDRVTRASR
jgi:L-threonylcarbamoyladenylate synthase